MEFLPILHCINVKELTSSSYVLLRLVSESWRTEFQNSCSINRKEQLEVAELKIGSEDVNCQVNLTFFGLPVVYMWIFQ